MKSLKGKTNLLSLKEFSVSCNLHIKSNFDVHKIGVVFEKSFHLLVKFVNVSLRNVTCYTCVTEKCNV